jgi:hypothetical protein
LKLADKVNGESPISSARGNITRDEGEMAFYRKKAQLKVHLFRGTNTAMPRD